MDADPEPGTSEPGETDPLVAGAVTDLAERLGVEESAVEVVSQEEVTWSDGSLGCAEPDMVYTQAMVDGSRIVLQVDGERHEYHAGGVGTPFLCEEPTE